MWLVGYNLIFRIEKKKDFFFAKLQTKVQKPVWKEENVSVMKLFLHKLKKSNLSNKHEQEQW